MAWGPVASAKGWRWDRSPTLEIVIFLGRANRVQWKDPQLNYYRALCFLDSA